MKNIKLILASSIICIGLIFTASANAQTCTPETAPGTGPEWQNNAPGTGPEWQNNAPGTGPEWQNNAPGTGPEWQTCHSNNQPGAAAPIPFFTFLRSFFGM